MHDLTYTNLQNEVEHLRAVNAQQDAMIERLRERIAELYTSQKNMFFSLKGNGEVLAAAVARAERVEEEIARVRGALGPFAQAAEKCDGLDRRVQDSIPIPIDDLLRARAALAPRPPEVKGE